MNIAEISFQMCFCGTELASIESFLARQPGVQSVAIDRTRSTAHVSYDPAATGPERLRSLLDSRGYGCDCTDCRASCCQAGHPAAGHSDTVEAHQRHATHAAAHHDMHAGPDRHAGDDHLPAHDDDAAPYERAAHDGHSAH